MSQKFSKSKRSKLVLASVDSKDEIFPCFYTLGHIKVIKLQV